MPSYAQNLSLQLTPSNYNDYNISLSGACNGWINTSATGGVEPYTYHWEQFNSLNQPNVTNLGCAWRTNTPLSNGLYTGFGMATSGWFWILSGGTGNSGTPFYPMYLTLAAGEPNGILLKVCGTISAMRLRVEIAGGCDYAFDEGYKRMSIIEKEKFYTLHKHLPSIQPAGEMLKEGMDIESVIKGLLIEAEETRLDLTDLSKQIIVLIKENTDLKSTVKQLRSINTIKPLT